MQWSEATILAVDNEKVSLKMSGSSEIEKNTMDQEGSLLDSTLRT